MIQLDQTAAIAIKGCVWLPDLRRGAGGMPVPIRVMGQRAVGIGGPSAARLFYGDGNLDIAAVELLTIIRPATAVAWFLSFSGHALDRWPEHRDPLRSLDPDFALAFTHEGRRFYPFTPFLGGRATRDLEFQGRQIPAGTLVLLDVYGQDHDPMLWERP